VSNPALPYLGTVQRSKKQNISSGDDGDFLAVDQADFGIDSVSVEARSSSPFATSVGGTSTFLNSNNTIKFQTGRA
jgi:subtilase family serine protease